MYQARHRSKAEYPTLLNAFTLLIILVVVAVNMFFLLWLAALPAQIARQRDHHQAEAIAICGWL